MGKQLRADIVIGGKAHNSFYRLGKELETLGSQINTLSAPLIEFGKESVKTYASYEDAMLDAQVAMRTQYETTSELGKAMESLDDAAQKWASDSRFTTQDVAGAISEAAHAGWDLEKVLNGVPAAMKISLAGGMSLAEGLEYLVDISNAAGLGFEDLGGLVDTWAFAANKSSTTIPEMGQAMQKMGATMQFVKGDMAGLTTMLAVLANNGAKGTEAGTLLRNSMIRLIAPTKSAAEAIDLLGISDVELDSLYSGASNLEEVNAMLEEAGFSAYDAKGDLKSFLTIFQELDTATSGMTEQDRNKVLSAIFPTRTITGALALLDAAKNGWDGLYDSIKTGSEGYAEYAADTMESGLGGSLRHLESVYNALQTKVGDALSEEVSMGADSLSGLIERANGMDEGKFNAIVAGLSTVAVAGPALMTAGGAVKLIGALLGTGPIGLMLLAGTALAAVGIALYNIDEASRESAFGELSLDAEELGEHIDTLGNSFQDTQREIDGYRDSVKQAVEAYSSAGENLKSGLLTAMLTDKTLTASDKANLQNYGKEMYSELLNGIQGSHSASEAALLSLDDFMSEEDDFMIGQITETLNAGFEDSIATAESLSRRLRDAMTSAFTDGMLNSDEITGIQSIMDEMNALMAEQVDKDLWLEQQGILRDAQTMGLDGLEELASRAAENRDKKWSNREKEYDNLLWDIEKSYLNGNITEAEYNEQIGFVNQKREAAKKSHDAEYDSFLLDLWNTTIESSDYADNWRDLEELAGGYLSGKDVKLSDFDKIFDSYSVQDRKNLAQTIDDVVDWFGGKDNLLDRADYYMASGNYKAGRELSMLAAMQEMARYSSQFMNGSSQYLNYESKDIAPIGNVGIPIDLIPPQGGGWIGELEQQGVDVSVDGDVTSLSATIDGEDGQTLVQYLDGDATDLHATIMDENGNVLKQIIAGDASELGEAIKKYDGQVVTVNVAYKNTGGIGKPAPNNPLWQFREFAGGGRADEASIFGEAGAEWAIPEEHTERTAELLSAAAQASGFTWPELLSRNGGLNAGSRGSYTLVYSPVITAQDAAGVEQKLQADKKRFEEWFDQKMRDMKLHDELEVYS